MITLFITILGCQQKEGYDMVIKVGPKNQTETAAPMDTADLCETAPYVSWDNKIRGLLSTHCQGCHASNTPYTYGAPESINFDTEEQAIELKDRIQIRTLDQEDMPPAGGLLADDKYLLQTWLSCWTD